MILGSGLGNVVDAVDIDVAIPYGEIPGARASTVMGHQGRLDPRPRARARPWR